MQQTLSNQCIFKQETVQILEFCRFMVNVLFTFLNNECNSALESIINVYNKEIYYNNKVNYNIGKFKDKTIKS